MFKRQVTSSAGSRFYEIYPVRYFILLTVTSEVTKDVLRYGNGRDRRGCERRTDVKKIGENILCLSASSLAN
jgi:hypothetical protein